MQHREVLVIVLRRVEPVQRFELRDDRAWEHLRLVQRRGRRGRGDLFLLVVGVEDGADRYCVPTSGPAGSARWIVRERGDL